MRKISKKPAGHIFNSHHNFDHTSDNAYYHKRGAISFGSEDTHVEIEHESTKDIWVKQMAGRRAGWTTASVKLDRKACDQGNERIFQAPSKKDRNSSPQRTQLKKGRCNSALG